MPADALCLAIETSNPSAQPGASGEVALARCPDWADPVAPIEMLSCASLSPTARHDDALAPAIDRLFRDASLRPTDLTRIAVSIGPGGFSALRIATAAAKMIAEATGARCVGVPSALVAAGAEGLPPRFVVLLASKGESAWATTFGPDGAEVGTLMEPADLAIVHRAAPLGALVGDEHIPPGFRAWAQTSRVPIAPIVLTAGALLRASRGMPESGPDDLSPLYPREPEAVRKWRELGRSKR